MPPAAASDPPKIDAAAQLQATAADALHATTEPEYHNELLRGRVGWLAEELKARFQITSVPEVAEHTLALLTVDGRLVPVVENLRGRAFRKDPRLREMDLEILARRYEQQPFVQVVKIFEVSGKQRYEIDYWCDVCAIIMYEYGPCACCQDQNRLRKQLVTPATSSQE